jgi:hypothetical protein
MAQAQVSRTMRAAKKIGVLTFHKCINYGSYWQARCLVEGLLSAGHDAVLLDHDSPEVNRAEVRCAFQPGLPRRTPAEMLSAYKAKTRLFRKAFRKLPTSDPFPIDRPAEAGEYDAIVVGSDEVWNFRHPWYADRPIFFGEGLRTGRLLSYAASFGNHDANRGIREDRAQQLRTFDAISVRDANSKALVEPALGREVEMVLDPCLQFADGIQVPQAQPAGAYVIVYGHGFPDWLQAAVRRWSKARSVPLISVGYQNDWADEQRIAVGPEEFAALMRGARAAVTNFFHGCVFSLLNDKPFVASRTEYRSNKVRDLLAQLSASERLVDAGSDAAMIGELLDEPPSSATGEAIRDYRHRSQAFLDAALA